MTSPIHIWPANGPLGISIGWLGELAISLCGSHSTGGVGRWSSKRPGWPFGPVV